MPTCKPPISPRRVGFVAHSPYLAGAERIFSNLLEYCNRALIRPFAIFPEADGPIKDEVESFGIPVITAPYSMMIPSRSQPSDQRNARLLASSEALAQCFAALELDGVLVNTTTLIPAMFAAAKAGLKCILHSHGLILPANFPDLDQDRWWIEKKLQLELSDKILTCSSYVRSYYQDAFAVPDEQIEVFPNGTRLGGWFPLSDASRRQKFNFVMLTTLEPHKGVMTFLKASKRVLEEIDGSIQFLVYGDGPPEYKDHLMKYIEGNSLGRHVHLLPKTKDVKKIYDDCYCVVVASYIEPFSLVTIEAMASGRPVIATRCGGPEEILEADQTGFFVGVEDDRALADRMLWLLHNPGAADQIGRSGRLSVEAKYDISVLGSLYSEKIFQALEEPMRYRSLSEKMNMVRLFESTLRNLRPPMLHANLLSTQANVNPPTATSGEAMIAAAALKRVHAILSESNSL